MLAPMVVLWLGSAPPEPQQRADIAAWTEARGFAPIAPPPEDTVSYDAALVERIEALLEEARSVAAVPGVAGASALERADALLLAHPELPQAAWLMAERYAVEAQALGTSVSARERRRALLTLSLALDGGRALPADQDGPAKASTTTRDEASAPTTSSEATSDQAARGQAMQTALVDLRELAELRPRDVLYIDGVPGAPPGAGRHHAQLYRAGRRLWARWVEAGHAGTVADPTRPCSTLDLADVAITAERPSPAPGVRCPRWVAARAAALGGTQLAGCSEANCGPWQTAPTRVPRAAAQLADGGRPWPDWATWGLIGAGAAAAAGIVLWQTGAFDRSNPHTEFVFTGPEAPGYRF